MPADQITGENIGSNATDYWAKVVQPCVDTGTKWVVVFGNHGKNEFSTTAWRFDIVFDFDTFADDLSRSNGTREDLLKFDMCYSLSLSQRSPVSYCHTLRLVAHVLYYA